MAGEGRKIGSKNKRTLLKEEAMRRVADDNTFDPFHYLVSVGRDPSQYDEHRFRAAEVLMPYKYPKLSSKLIDADVDAKVNVVELDKSGGRG